MPVATCWQSLVSKKDKSPWRSCERTEVSLIPFNDRTFGKKSGKLLRSFFYTRWGDGIRTLGAC
jgi:hypothetical protein